MFIINECSFVMNILVRIAVIVGCVRPVLYVALAAKKPKKRRKLK